eukprot:6475657-Amphidinium_carterae.1
MTFSELESYVASMKAFKCDLTGCASNAINLVAYSSECRQKGCALTCRSGSRGNSDCERSW